MTENTYGAVVDRIRRGLPLSQHQKEVMQRCGLTEEDFRDQKSDAEKAAIINAHRMISSSQRNKVGP